MCDDSDVIATTYIVYAINFFPMFLNFIFNPNSVRRSVTNADFNDFRRRLRIKAEFQYEDIEYSYSRASRYYYVLFVIYIFVLEFIQL